MDLTPQRQNDFLEVLVDLQLMVHATAVKAGYWDLPLDSKQTFAKISVDINSAMSLILRDNTSGRSDKLREFTKLEETLADAVIRIFDYAQGKGLSVAAATVAKMRYNSKIAALQKSPM